MALLRHNVVFSKRLNKNLGTLKVVAVKVLVEVVPSFQSTQGGLVAPPDCYKAALEAFIGFT